MTKLAENEVLEKAGEHHDWVTIYHPETHGEHTCPCEAFEEEYKAKGWRIETPALAEEAEKAAKRLERKEEAQQ